jgi:hypothetical protein
VTEADRRNPGRQQELLSGNRWSDPLDVSYCARALGYDNQWVIEAIERGKYGHKLTAAILSGDGSRRNFKIYRDDLVAFAHAIGWRNFRLPPSNAAPSPGLRPARRLL